MQWHCTKSGFVQTTICALCFSNSLRMNKLTNDGGDFSGLEALGHALKDNASLTECNLRDNQLGEEGWCVVFDALRDNPQNKISKWDLSCQYINPTITNSLAAYMAVSASLTSLK